MMRENLDLIKNRIEEAKKRSGREKDDIKLIAVSKTQTIEAIIKAKNLGLKVFGENKVQELVEKYPLVEDVEWHLIGHLQKNKVKYIIDKVNMIHSVDSIELGNEINKRAEAIGVKMPVLLQVNIGKESSKSGVFEEDAINMLIKLSEFDNLIISGLMTVPPVSSDENITRAYFRKMNELLENAKKLKYDNFNIKYLSMGMTEDFEIAIEEGANIVRVGTGIFGKRVYKEE